MTLHPWPKPSRRVKPKTLRVAKAVKAFAAHRVPEYQAWIRTFACLLVAKHICDGRVECHHVRGRKADDVGTCVPLCSLAHHQWHTWGRVTFQRRYAIDVLATAVELGKKYHRDVNVCP